MVKIANFCSVTLHMQVCRQFYMAEKSRVWRYTKAAVSAGVWNKVFVF